MTAERTPATGPASLRLERYPEPEVNLQAWNAADSYLLDWVAEHRTTGDGPCCVVNDSFGALALGLVKAGEQLVVSWSDSWIAHEGARANAAVNNIAAEDVDWVPSTRTPSPPRPAAAFGLVVLRIPKAIDQLQDQLRRLAPFVGPETLMVGGGMTKHIHTSTIACFDDEIVPATTSRARKKARLIVARVDPDTPRPDADSLSASGRARIVGPTGLTFVSDPALFSSTRIDRASALLLDAVGSNINWEPITDVIDMGCGAGVIGLTLLERIGRLAMTFTDESYGAVESSRAAWEENLAAGRLDQLDHDPRFIVDDCGSTIADASADLVCINPPFHDANTRTSAIADRMFANSARILRPGGRIVVVGNRHLGYHSTLRRWFTTPTVIASDRRFVVLSAGSRR